MNTTTLTLTFPVTLNGIETTALSMRRPKVRDMLVGEKKGKSDAEREIHVFANLCEVTPDLIQELDMADYAELQKTYQDFLS